MNWKLSGNKQSSAHAWRDEVMVAGVLAEIRTEQLRNTGRELYCYTNFPVNTNCMRSDTRQTKLRVS
jgi:hypothetical protein